MLNGQDICTTMASYKAAFLVLSCAVLLESASGRQLQESSCNFDTVFSLRYPCKDRPVVWTFRVCPLTVFHVPSLTTRCRGTGVRFPVNVFLCYFESGYAVSKIRFGFADEGRDRGPL
ncbi:unnamed protein product, partial [Pylaiella littoralis]